MKVKIEHWYKDYQSRPGELIAEIYVEDTPENIRKFVESEDLYPEFRNYDELDDKENFINGESSYLSGEHTDYFVRITKDEAINKATKKYNDKLSSIEYNFK